MESCSANIKKNDYDNSSMRPLPNCYEEFQKELKEQKSTHGYRLRDVKIDYRATVLSYAHDSYKITRSAYHTVFVLLGESGVGKSSTINHLFGQQVAGISHSRSKTRSTSEYVISKDDPEHYVKELTLGVVDTPGLMDTEGLEQDACNLASIKKMLHSHKPLLSFKQRPHVLFPNIILLFLKATDKRFEGANSAFTKTLKVINEMKIVDTKKNNVVVVISNVMSFGNPNKVDRWTSGLQNKTRKIQSLVMNSLSVYPEVVWVENHIEDDDDASDEDGGGHDLERDGGWTVLPDQTRQIKNLYDAISSLLQSNGDNLALHTVNSIFKARYNGPVRETTTVQAKIAKESGTQLDEMEKEMLDILKRESGLSLLENPDNEFKAKINQWLVSQSLEASQANEAQRLNLILWEHLNIRSEKQLIAHSIGSIKQIMDNPDNLTELHVRMLQEIFGVQHKKRPAIVSLLGRGYDVTQDDDKKAKAIIKFSEEDSYEADFGMQVPQGIKLEVARETSVFMEDFHSDKDYVQRRLTDLGVSLDLTDYSKFSMKSRAGYNKSFNAQKNNSMKEFSFLFEKRFHQLSISNLDDAKALTLSNDFQDAVQQLPEDFKEQDVDYLRDMKSFFDVWGQYVVVEAYAGGSVSVHFVVDKDAAKSDDKTQFETMAAISGKSKEYSNLDLLMNHGRIIAGKANVLILLIMHISQLICDSSIGMKSTSMKWKGGDAEFQVQSLSKLDGVCFQQWEQSLALNPAILTTNLTLLPIYELIRDPKKKKAVRDAHYNIFGTEQRLKQVQKPAVKAAPKDVADQQREDAVKDKQPIGKKKCRLL